MKARRLLIAIFLFPALAFVCQAQQSAPWEIRGLNTNSEWHAIGDTNYFSHGGMVSNETATVSFDNGTADSLSGEVVAEGDVTILDHGHIWRGTNFIYNFKTGVVRSATFKTLQGPFQLTGAHMIGTSNNIYTATNAYITTDDYDRPAYTIRARSITIALGQYFEAHQATLYWGRTPVFYFPYYRRSLGQHPNNWEFEPGYRSLYGPYLLSAYNWYGNGMLDGTVHFDVRERRGIAGGPDLNLHLGQWGEAAFRYYYANDQQPTADGYNNVPHLGENRQRLTFDYEVQPTSNLTAKVVANYQSDPLILRDFFEREYVTNVEPNSFAEVSQLWPNYTLNVLAQPQLVNYFETVERLPDIKLSGLRQQVGDTPLFYESESSVGYFERAFSGTNALFFTTNENLLPGSPGFLTAFPQGHNYEATRLDTFHQFTLPETLFGWLNLTPRVGGRMTYYGDVYGPAIHTNAQTRAVFNTGMDVSFKASQVFPNAESSLLDVHELRHIIEPDIDYVYVPAPTRSPSQIPQFDYTSPSIGLLPIDFPDNNNIDSIGGMNVMRLTLRNKLQTKRPEGVQDLVNLSITADYNLDPGTNHPWGDLYTDMAFRPRSWLTFDSSTRYDMVSNRWREAVESLVVQPSTAWSLALTYRYLMNNDPEFETYLGENLAGHNLITGSVYYRMNENWGLHIMEQYEAQYGGLQQQVYSIYRDLRSWTASLMFRITEGPGQPTDFTVALTFSLKAFPRYGVGSDSDRAPAQYGNVALMDPLDRY